MRYLLPPSHLSFFFHFISSLLSSPFFSPVSQSVIVLGATNLPWELDAAFLRRFEKRIHIDLPDAEARLAMFELSTEGMNVAESAREGGTWKTLVEMSEGYSGADLATVCNDASMLGLRRLLAGKTPEEMKKMVSHTYTHIYMQSSELKRMYICERAVEFDLSTANSFFFTLLLICLHIGSKSIQCSNYT